MSFLKRGTMLLIATRMSVCAFKRFLDIVLIDKILLNPDLHRYVVANGMSTTSAVSQSLGNITMPLIVFQKFTIKLHFKSTI